MVDHHVFSAAATPFEGSYVQQKPKVPRTGIICSWRAPSTGRGRTGRPGGRWGRPQRALKTLLPKAILAGDTFLLSPGPCDGISVDSEALKIRLCSDITTCPRPQEKGTAGPPSSWTALARIPFPARESCLSANQEYPGPRFQHSQLQHEIHLSLATALAIGDHPPCGPWHPQSSQAKRGFNSP